MNISGNQRHSFICSDTATNKLLFIDKDGNITREISDLVHAYDIWVLPDESILCAHISSLDSCGLIRLDKNGNQIMQYLTGKELFSCQPLENGNILLGLLGDAELQEIDSKGNIVNQISIPYEGDPHNGMRLARKIGNTYYVLQPGICKLRKLSFAGEIVTEFDIHPDAFGLVVLPNGHIVYSCMSGAYELDENGKEIWSLTNEDIPQINIRWLLGVQLLSNGNLVFTNWMGHGHIDEGIHFFEVNRQKEIVWSFDGRGTLKTPATLQILDEDLEKVCFTPLK